MDDRCEMWYENSLHARIKDDKVVVKIRGTDGKFKSSCIVPTTMYPLNGKMEVFSARTTELVTDANLLKVFDSVYYHVGHCYQNSIDLAAALKERGYNADTYVGWLFLSSSAYPIHHSWVVVDNHVLDLSDDYTIMLHEKNGKNFQNCNNLDEQREMLASFRIAAAKHPNSIRCAPVGSPSSFLLYVGSKCNPNDGRAIYRDLIKKYPNHPVHANVGKDGLNQTQKLLKEKGLL